jgi:hypothetical protein
VISMDVDIEGGMDLKLIKDELCGMLKVNSIICIELMQNFLVWNQLNQKKHPSLTFPCVERCSCSWLGQFLIPTSRD